MLPIKLFYDDDFNAETKRAYQIQDQGNQEWNKISMIFISQAIIYIWAVVVKFLNTSFTEVTME